jgi:hypothetical protein
MIKILLDECLPKNRKYRIEELDQDFVAKSVPEVCWDRFTNEDLLPLCEKLLPIIRAHEPCKFIEIEKRLMHTAI